MSWNVNLEPIDRGTIGTVLDEHRRSRGGYVPDVVVELMQSEIEALDVRYTKVEVVTYGHMTSDLDGGDVGAERSCTFSIQGSQ